jgi:hypothetical protein
MFSLDRFLADYDMAMLRVLAQNRGTELTTNQQTEAAVELAAILVDAVSVRTILARISPQARDALASLLIAGRQIRAPQFARRFGKVRPIGPGRLEREAPWQDPANATEELWYAGLIFRGFSQDEGGSGEFIFVPDELVPLLPTVEQELPEFLVEPVPDATRQHARGSTLPGDLFTYLVYIQNHDVRAYADGRLAQRDLVALRRQLSQADKRRMAFLQHLATRMGVVARQGEHLRIESAPTRRWLSATPAGQLTALQETWRDDPTWNDLCRVPTLVCDQETPWRNDPQATRRALLALLARCPLNVWWLLSSFVAAVKEVHPDFQRPDGDYASWYIRDAANGEYYSGFESWNDVEGALLADLLGGVLHWLGIVDTFIAEDGVVCRLTAAGAQFLGLASDQPQDPQYPPLIIHSDSRIDVPPPASLYSLFQVERFADSLDTSPSAKVAGQKGRSYRLSPASLGRALTRGIQVEQVLAFLQQASGRPVPANVAGQLRLWAGRFGQVQLDEVALLQVKSERVLKELSRLPETRSLIGKILSPTSALVRKNDLPRLRRELGILGYLPSAETSGDAAERG